MPGIPDVLGLTFRQNSCWPTRLVKLNRRVAEKSVNAVGLGESETKAVTMEVS